MKNKLLLYFTLIKNGFKANVVYSASMFLSMLSSLTTFFIQIFIWFTLLKNGAIYDVSFRDMATYLVITTLITNLLDTDLGRQVTQRVNEGSIEMDLVKPIGLKYTLFFDNIGSNLFKVFTMLPVLIGFSAIFGFILPTNPLLWFYLIISVINGIMILFYYRYILGLLSFWLIRNPFVQWYFGKVEAVFSGSIIPIWFYPVWLASVTKYMPFRYFIFEPVSIFLGKTPSTEVWRVLLMQFLWMIIFYVIERLLWNRAYRKLIVQGG
jgi:ABC-2 type transport system permease protein